MNNSLDRMLEGIMATLDAHVMPNLTDDFARGQAFGIVYMLRCIRKRAAWSSDYLRAQLDALRDLSAELRPLLAALPGAPTVPDVATPDLEQARVQLNEGLCAAYDWVEGQHAGLPHALVREVRAAWERHITRQLKTELKFNVSLNFSEISTGQAAHKDR
jgi:hypothetical protein